MWPVVLFFVLCMLALFYFEVCYFSVKKKNIAIEEKILYTDENDAVCPNRTYFAFVNHTSENAFSYMQENLENLIIGDERIINNGDANYHFRCEKY